MTSTTVCAALLQPLDVVEDISAEVVLDFHVGQGSREVKDLLVGQFADLACRVDMESSEELRGGLVSDSEETLERFLVEVLDRDIIQDVEVDWRGRCLP